MEFEKIGLIIGLTIGLIVVLRGFWLWIDDVRYPRLFGKWVDLEADDNEDLLSQTLVCAGAGVILGYLWPITGAVLVLGGIALVAKHMRRYHKHIHSLHGKSQNPRDWE